MLVDRSTESQDCNHQHIDGAHVAVLPIAVEFPLPVVLFTVGQQQDIPQLHATESQLNNPYIWTEPLRGLLLVLGPSSAFPRDFPS